MRFKTIASVFGFALAFFVVAPEGMADGWLQFRGPGGAGTSREAFELSNQIGPNRAVAWKQPVGRGHSSPVVSDGRVFLTTKRDKRLSTLALDAASGKVLWEADAAYKKLESIHRIGSHATPSCATDGEVVVSFFGSSGLHAYSVDGERLWSRPLGPFNNSFGAAASPVIVDDLVIVLADHDTDGFLAALDKRTGEQVWRVDRSEFRRNYSTPVIWKQLATVKFDEDVYATPAVAGGRLYIRTVSHLYCFGRGS